MLQLNQQYQLYCISCINCIEHCQNVNYIDRVNWIFNRSDLFQCTDYFVSRWYYICFCFSSFSLSNWQSLLWKLDLNSLFGIFRLEFHSFEWELCSDLVLNCCLSCFTLLAAVSTNINRFQNLKYTIIYINYTKNIDIYCSIFLLIKLVWVVIVGNWSYNSTNNYFVCFVVNLCMCVVHPLLIFLGLYCHINSFVLCCVVWPWKYKS